MYAVTKINSRTSHLSGSEEHNHIFSYLMKLIDIYSALSVSRDSWLTDREKDFFIVTLFNYLQGDTDPKSPKATARYKNYFNREKKNVEISVYLNKLVKKEWIVYHKDRKPKHVEVPAFFKGIDSRAAKLTIDVRIDYKPDAIPQ